MAGAVRTTLDSIRALQEAISKRASLQSQLAAARGAAMRVAELEREIRNINRDVLGYLDKNDLRSSHNAGWEGRILEFLQQLRTWWRSQRT